MVDNFSDKSHDQLIAELAALREKVSILQRNEKIHKETIAKLSQPSKFYENLISYANAPIIIWDKDLNITKFNTAFERMTGFFCSEIIGKKLIFLFPKNSQKFSLDNIQQALDGTYWESVEIPILCKNGDVRIALWNSANIYADDENFLATIAQGQDITERKQAENELRETRDYLDNLLTHANVPIIVWDPQLRITRFNHAFEELTGQKAEEVIGKSLDLLFPHKTKANAFQHIGQTVTGERWDSLEIPIVHKNGEVRSVLWNSATLFESDDRTVVATIAQGQDITARKKIQKSLRVSQTQYRTLLQSTLGIAWKFDLEKDRWSYVAPQAERILGYAPDEWRDLAWWQERIHPEDRERASEYCRTAILRGEDHAIEYRFIRKNGEIVWVNDIATLEMRGGTTIGMQGIIIDISERKNLEEQLHQVDKIRAIGQFSGGIAHDFNNILAIILGNTDLLQFKVNPDHSINQNIEYIKTAANRGKDLVSQILTFSRHEKQHLHPVNLSRVINESLKLLKATTPTTIQMHELFDTPCGPISINADKTQIQQVLFNLCANAVHAMDEKGLLKINLREVELTSKEFPAAVDLQPGKYARLTVSDTGRGMDKETVNKIFDPFFTTKEIGEGTGMGLSVVHGIVSHHLGFITVDSTPGEGTSFAMYFPTTQEVEALLPTETAKNLPDCEGRILFVDDEENLAEVCKELLELQGYKVTCALGSVDALNMFKASPDAFDLVFTDQTMPEMSGCELSAEILKIRSDMPIILCSGYSAKVSKKEAKEIGIREFCMKPMDMEQLVTAARKVLAGKGAHT